MTPGPIDKRLRDCADDADRAAARAADLLQAVPEPSPLSEWGRKRTLRALRASGRNGRSLHFSVLHWAVLSVLVVSTAAASSKRMWFPTWFHRKVNFVERTIEAVPLDPPAIQAPSKASPPAREEPASSGATSHSPKARASSAKRAIASVEEPRSEPIRPRLLSDPQNDAVARTLPKAVYDAEMYSVLLDVCVSTEGDVTRVSIMRGQEASLDRDILEAVRRWRYRPGEVEGTAVAMCFPLVYRIQVQRD
jgi:TonB family protein